MAWLNPAYTIHQFRNIIGLFLYCTALATPERHGFDETEMIRSRH
jgi:hypothetical protein